MVPLVLPILVVFSLFKSYKSDSFCYQFWLISQFVASYRATHFVGFLPILADIDSFCLFSPNFVDLFQFLVDFLVPILALLKWYQLWLIERLLVSNRARLFYTLRETWSQLQQAYSSSEVTVFPEFDDDSMKFWRASPVHHAIGACFLENFWLRESTYHHRMSLTSLSHVSPWLTCDHTFKSVCNIGAVRPADKHWIKQYAGLFCIMNADGQVLSWKLTKTVTFEHTEDKLLALRGRLQKYGSTSGAIFCGYMLFTAALTSEHI